MGLLVGQYGFSQALGAEGGVEADETCVHAEEEAGGGGGGGEVGGVGAGGTAPRGGAGAGRGGRWAAEAGWVGRSRQVRGPMVIMLRPTRMSGQRMRPMARPV